MRIQLAPHALQDFLPAISEKRVLNLVDDKDFLVREIQRGAAWGDELRCFAFDHRLRRNIAGVGVIPDSDKGFTNIAVDLDPARFDGCDEFFAIGQDRKTFRRINAGPRAGDYRTRRDIALIGTVAINSLRDGLTVNPFVA